MNQQQQAASSTGTRGRHRILAELKRLEQETSFLTSEHGSEREIARGVRSVDTEEFEKVDKMEMASAACKELLSIVEVRPDPLLPETHGPVNPSWDRWFEGPQESKGCKCWIL